MIKKSKNIKLLLEKKKSSYILYLNQENRFRKINALFRKRKGFSFILINEN